MEWAIREHFLDYYNGIAVKQDNTKHNKYGEYENLKHCLPKLCYSDKAIIIFKPYNEWVESINKIGYTETSIEAYLEFIYNALRLPIDKRYIVEYSDFVNNYEDHMISISKFLNIPIKELKPIPKYKFNRDGGKTLSKEVFKK